MKVKSMRAILPLFLIILFFQVSIGQSLPPKNKHINYHLAKNIHIAYPNQTSSAYLQDLKSKFDLANEDSFEQLSSLLNKSGFTREKYQQHHKGIPVVGAKYFLHIKDGLVNKSTGNILPSISINENPSILKSSAVKSAKEFIEREIIKTDQLQENLTFDFHDIKLCIIDRAYPDFSGNYKLAFQIFAEANTYYPIHERIFVDAHNGKVISSFTEICDHSVPGVVKTKYYGEQSIIADSINPTKYVLRDSIRGVFTIKGPDSDSSLDLRYPDFCDDDNYWNNVNEDFDEVGGDAHYCASSFHDFLNNEFGWKGLDNQGLELVTVVHASRKYYTNAYWNGDKVFVGNGDCDQYDPLTVLDVIGHEFTHAVIDHSCDLVYQDEPGALNESLSDILGKSLEYKYDQDNFTWLIGNKFRTEDPDGGFRNMKNPNEENDPKFYQGVDWHFSASDRGGVHTNSGVLNYWFYLLVEGESGINEVGYEYDVKAIGIDDALQIVFGCMTGYFTENTDYPEAMRLSLEQSADLFGVNSQQYESVVEAWMTVGLYEGIDDFDLSLEEVADEYFGCPDSEIFPEVIVRNSGIKTFDAGTQIELSYVYDGGAIEVFEDYYLLEDLMPGDSILFQFSNPITFFPDIKKDLIFYLFNIDNLIANNSLNVDLEFSEIEGSDIELRKFTFRVDDECNPSELSSYKIEFTNIGCEPITGEDSLILKITTDLEVLEIPYEIFNNVKPGSVIVSFRNFNVDLLPGFENFSVELIFERDQDYENNIFLGSFQIPEGIDEGYLEEFEEQDYRDKLKINTSFNGQDSIIQYKNSNMLAFARTGSNNIENCVDPEDLFNENSKQATINACLNAEGMEDPVFGMHITQIRNGIDVELDESLRTIVKASNDSLSYPLIYNQESEATLYHEFDLPVDFIGNFRIEVFTYSRERNAFDPVGLDSLDAVLFDNLELYDRADRPVIPEVTEYEVYPNLVHQSIQVISPNFDVEYDFIIFDVLGRRIYEESIFGSTEILLNWATNGAYFYVIKEGMSIAKSGKLLKIE